MPDDAPKPDWFQESDERVAQLKEMARQLREGSDVPMDEQLKRLNALMAEASQERSKPTQADKEWMLAELRKKHGNLPGKTLMLKEVGARLKDFRAFSQEMRRASKQDIDSAIFLGDVEQVRSLIATGVDVNRLSVSGNSLLMFAGIQGQWEIFEALWAAGVKVGLPEAAITGDVDMIQALLDSGADVNAADAKLGLTALNWAASKGRTEAVRVLLERGADVDHAAVKGFTPLVSAAVHNHKEVVARLLAAGASVGVVEAALLGNEEQLVHWLDEGTDIESENAARMTPLMAAAACGQTGCIRLLLDRGADLHKVNAGNLSALTWAISQDRREAVLLLMSAGMDVNAPNQRESEYFRGSTPIRYAIMHRLSEMTRLLVAHGARVDVRDVRGQTPLHWATRHSSPDVMRVLLDAGADVNAVDVMQRTPLMSVVDDILVKQEVHLSCVRLLLESGADVNARAEHGKTALMMAAGRGHTEIVKLLLEAGADIEATDEHGFSALAAAAQDGHAEVVALLKQYGAKVGSVHNFLGAALFGHNDVLKTLLLPQFWKRKQPGP